MQPDRVAADRPDAAAIDRPDAAAIDRFARDLARLATLPTVERPLALAVSGGPDSMAMLALAAAAFPGRVIAATVDHALRADAAAEAAMVAGWAGANGVPHATLTADRPPAGASLQAQARHLRYALLGDWAIAQAAGALATAHHADDQAETFLMRAARGSGPAGLAGIRPKLAFDAAWWATGVAARPGTPSEPCTSARPPTPPRPQTPSESPASSPPHPSSQRRLGSPALTRHPTPQGDPSRRWGDERVVTDAGAAGEAGGTEDAPLTIIRPLLTWRRAELRAIAATLPFVDDPSNADPRHDRTAARALLATGAIDPAALAAAAAHCREADAALADATGWLWRTRRRPDGGIDMTGLPRELRRRLCRMAIGDLRRTTGITEGRWSDAANIEALLTALSAGRPATQAGIRATATGDVWHFRQSPPRRP